MFPLVRHDTVKTYMNSVLTMRIQYNTVQCDLQRTVFMYLWCAALVLDVIFCTVKEYVSLFECINGAQHWYSMYFILQ